MPQHTAITLSTLMTLTLAGACLDSDERPSSALDEASETSTSSGAGTDSDAGTGDTEGSIALDVELFVDGQMRPEGVSAPQIVELTAEVTRDDHTVDFELRIDGEAVDAGSGPLYAYDLVLADASHNGVRVLTARVVDDEGNVAEDTVLLPVEMPAPGTSVWELQLDDAAVGLALGDDDLSLVATRLGLHVVDVDGEVLGRSEFDHAMSAAAATPDGGIIVLGTEASMLRYRRYDAVGRLERADQLEDGFAEVEQITGASYGHGDRLIVSWQQTCAPLPCQRLGSLRHMDTLLVDWSVSIEREGMAPTGSLALEVGPLGNIYVGAAFAHDEAWDHLQLRRIGQGGAHAWGSEELGLVDDAHGDVAPTASGIYVGGRFDGRAAIAKYSYAGEKVAVHHVEGEAVTRLIDVGAGVVYVSRLEDAEGRGMMLGRLDADGEVAWSVISPRGEGEEEEVRALERDSLGHVHVLSELSTGQARLQRVAL